jgi:hypothetical protein
MMSLAPWTRQAARASASFGRFLDLGELGDDAPAASVQVVGDRALLGCEAKSRAALAWRGNAIIRNELTAMLGGHGINVSLHETGREASDGLDP